jgi:hypothetical protein
MTDYTKRAKEADTQFEAFHTYRHHDMLKGLHNVRSVYGARKPRK